MGSGVGAFMLGVLAFDRLLVCGPSKSLQIQEAFCSNTITSSDFGIMSGIMNGVVCRPVCECGWFRSKCNSRGSVSARSGSSSSPTRGAVFITLVNYHAVIISITSDELVRCVVETNTLRIVELLISLPCSARIAQVTHVSE